MQPSFQQLANFWSRGYEAFKQADKINTRAWHTLNKQHLEFVSLCLDCGRKQFTALTNGHTAQELRAMQSDIAMEFTTTWVDQLQSVLTSATETAREVTAYVSGWLNLPAALQPSAEAAAAPSSETAVSEAGERAAPRVIGKPKKSIA